MRSVSSITVQGFPHGSGFGGRTPGLDPYARSLLPTPTNQATATRRNDDETDPKICCCHFRRFA